MPRGRAPRLKGVTVALMAIGLHAPAYAQDASQTPSASPAQSQTQTQAPQTQPQSQAQTQAPASTQTSPAAPTPVIVLPVTEVVGTTPLGGVGVPLSQFPANVQRLGSKEAKEQGSSNLADFLNANLGQVSVSDGTGNAYQNDVNYRGFSASSLLGAPIGLSVYFDGVRMNEPFGAVVNWDLIPMNAMSSTTVMPGSNPVFGLNTLGGALVVDTKNGKDDPGVSISALGGSFGRKAVSFEAGGADEKHGTDFFLAGNYDRQDGFRPFNNSDVKQLYGKARWTGNGGDTRFELSGAYADSTLGGTQSVPLDMLASNWNASYTAPDTISNRMAFINLKGSQWLNENNQISGNVYYRHANLSNDNSNAGLDDSCFDDDGSPLTNGSGGFKCGNQAPNGTALNNVTGANALALGYGRWTSDINASMVDSITTEDTVGANLQWSNFSKLLGHKNSFTLGAAWDHSRISYDQTTYLARLIDYQTVVIPNQEYGFTSNGLPPSASNLPTFGGSNVLNTVNLSSNVNDYSLYFTDTLNVTKRLTVTASGSFNFTSLTQGGANNTYLNDDGGYSWTDDVTGVSYYNPGYVNAYKYSNSGTGAATSPNGIPAGAIAGPESNSLSGAHEYHRFNPAIGFSYDLGAGQNVFGGYSESMRAPTSIELSCANPNSPCSLPTGFNGDPDLKAVVARTFELGGRGRIGHFGHWNASVYDSRLSNDIQFIATSNTYGYFANVGDTERRGFELGADATFAKLFVSANFGYVNAIYKSAFTTSSGQNVTSGDMIPGIPARTFKLRAAYELNPQILVGGNLILASKQIAHGNESNTIGDGGTVAGYGIVNLDFHYRPTKNLEISAYVDNLFNKRFSTYGLAGTSSLYTLASEEFLTPAPPRAIWVGLTYSFGGKSQTK